MNSTTARTAWAVLGVATALACGTGPDGSMEGIGSDGVSFPGPPLEVPRGRQPRTPDLQPRLLGGVGGVEVGDGPVGSFSIDTEGSPHHLKWTARSASGAHDVLLWVRLRGGLEQPALAPGSEVVVTRHAPRAADRLHAEVLGCTMVAGNGPLEYDERADTTRILSLSDAPPGMRHLRIESHFDDTGQVLVAEATVALAGIPPWPWVEEDAVTTSASLDGRDAPVMKAHGAGDAGYTVIEASVLDLVTGVPRIMTVELPRGLAALAPGEVVDAHSPDVLPRLRVDGVPADPRTTKAVHDPAAGGITLAVTAVLAGGEDVELRVAFQRLGVP